MDPYHFPDEGPVAFRQERDLGDVVRAAIEWTRDMAPVWIPALVAIAGPLYLASAVITVVAGVDGAMFGSFLDLGAGLLSSAAIFGILRRYREGAPDVTVGEAWEEAKAWAGPLFVFGLVTAGLAILLIIPFGLVAAALGIAATSPVAIAVVGLLFLVVGVLLAPYYALGVVSRVFDEDASLDAYKRAARLIAPHRGFATGTVFVVYGVMYFVVFAIAAALAAALEVLGSSPLVEAVVSLFSLAALVPATVFGTVASTFLFESLVEREEGTLLDAEIEAIREEPAPALPEAPPPAHGPDTRGFAERLRDGAEPSPAAPSDSDDEGPRPGGFRGGGFGDRA